MPIKAIRTINPTQVRNFGRFGDAVDVPPLTDVQTKSYDRFLQLDSLPEKRTEEYQPLVDKWVEATGTFPG